VRTAAAMAVVVLLLAGCSSNADGADDADAPAAPGSATSSTSPHAGHETTARPAAALRRGERFVEVAMPRAYTPKAPTTGTDDYRCFLLDPGLEEDAFVTGIDVVPDRVELVHHVILFQVSPGAVCRAEAIDAGDPGQGWTCFGGSGLDGAAGDLDNAPWLGAWAPGGGERILAPDVGIPLRAGSRVVMQVHYNLLDGTAEDRSRARLRLAPGTRDLAALETVLLPAPVELPCRAEATGPLCDRDAALADVQARFGTITGATANYLNLVCRGQGAAPVQSCSRLVSERATIRAVAGHMHLLGREIKVEVNPGRPDARTVLDIPVWNFDDQGSVPVRPAVRLSPGDELTVTCRHDQELRDLLPSFEGQPERYVLWGEGSTDEMCLGIVLVTRP
jgi:hypothetical protein